MKSRIIEVTKNNTKGISDLLMYVRKENNKYIFTDLRTKIDIKEIGVSREYDFSEENITSIERLYRYQNADTNGFDLDYCKTCRIKYSFKVMSDLYSMLWGVKLDDNIVDSSETIISSRQNIVRVFPELKKKQRGRPSVDWELFRKNKDDELEELSYRIATIGNYLPVPACEQKILNLYFNERFDILLKEIRKFYEDNTHHKSFTEEFKHWLTLFVDEKNNKLWEIFVKRNFLMGSFVGADFEVISFDGTAKQLSTFIYKRSKVMIDEYEKRIKQLGAN